MENLNMQSNNYIVIQGWMCNELGLKGNELLIFAMIHGFSQDGVSKYYGGRKYIADTFNISLPTVDKALQGLLDKEYIIKHISGDYINPDSYWVNLEVVKKLYEGSKETLHGGSKETLLNKASKQTKGKKEKVVSKDTTTEFQFGSKQSKPKKENLYTKCVATIQAFTTNDTLRDYLKTFLDLRLEIARDEGKSFYFGMWTHLLSELKQLAFKNNKLDEELACEIVLKSTSRGWKHFYEITDNGFVKNYDVKNKPWEQGLCSDGYTEDEKREIDRLTAEREARGEQVWY